MCKIANVFGWSRVFYSTLLHGDCARGKGCSRGSGCCWAAAAVAAAVVWQASFLFSKSCCWQWCESWWEMGLRMPSAWGFRSGDQCVKQYSSLPELKIKEKMKNLLAKVVDHVLVTNLNNFFDCLLQWIWILVCLFHLHRKQHTVTIQIYNQN